MKITCNIINDLLPLYVDHLCSQDTAAFIEEHLQSCDQCKHLLEMFQTEIKSPAVIDAATFAQAKKPFAVIAKKNKKYTILVSIVTAIIVSLTVLLLFLSYNEWISGEGPTFTSISSKIKAEKAMRFLISEEYDKAADLFYFSGILPENNDLPSQESISKEKSLFIRNMTDFFSHGFKLVRYNNVEFKADDGFVVGKADILIQDESRTYDLMLTMSGQNGQLCPIYVTVNSTTEDVDAEKIAQKLSNIICTYYPG